MAVYHQEDQSLSGHPPADISKRDRVKYLTQEVKANVRELLHHDNGQQEPEQNTLLEDPAFDPQKVLEVGAEPKRSLSQRLSNGARTIAGIVKNPKAASRNNYTRRAAAKIANHPHDRTDDFDNELLEAHDALADAEEQAALSVQRHLADPEQSANAPEVQEAKLRVERIEQQREDLRSGWILGRMLVRVKSIRPMAEKPQRIQFLSPSDPLSQRPPQTQWARYFGHLFLWYTQPFTAYRIDDFDEPPFDFHELALTIERFAAVSTPWQTYFTKVRDIYRWEDPTRTTQIMLTYWVLWYFQQITTFALGFIIYITVRNKLYPTSVEAVRERVKRSKDGSATVRAWGELIQKHGGNDWVEPLIDLLGPHLQLQLDDLASFLERLQNFYRWERPRQTWFSLAFFSFALIFSLFCTMETFVRVTSFGLGCYFFYSFPIAANYPKYRHLVSPLSWLVWAVPDSAELAIDQLQQKVLTRDITRLAEEKLDFDPQQVFGPEPGPVFLQLNHHLLTPQNLPTRPLSPHSSRILDKIRITDTLTFKTIVLPDHSSANLILTRTDMIFEFQNQSSISHPYTSLLEIRKVDLNTNSNQSSSSADTNHLSRTGHITKRLDKMFGDSQFLPDGLGFIFLQQDSEGSNHLSELQHHSISDRTQEYAKPIVRQSEPIPNEHPLSVNPDHVSPKPQNTTNAHNNRHRLHKTEMSLVLNKSDRDKIFAAVIAWSGLKWQPLYSLNRQNRLGSRDAEGEGNRNLDDAVKKALS